MEQFVQRLVSNILGVCLTISICAQEHPFIATYTLTEFDGGIRLDWTIQGGSTCNGQDVERSTDGVNFVSVHRIEGICGDPSVAVPFNWFDASPPEFSTVYYRVKLGFDGYTSVKSVVFDQLTTSEQRFFPNPMTGEATLVVNTGSLASIHLRIWDSNGQLVFERPSASGPVIPISMPEAPSGTYLYMAQSDGRSFVGVFVKVN